MKVIKDIYSKINSLNEGIISIGFFDSFHLGHKKILDSLVKISREQKLTNYVLTYDSLPVKKNSHEKILTLEKKLETIAERGVDNILLCDYNDEFRHIKPEAFLTLLKENFNIKQFVVGKDFNFGLNRSGNIDDLKENSLKVHLVEPVIVGDEKISTSAIKRYLKVGDIDRVNSFLGRPYSIDGVVKKGKQLGRVLGFPTMNIHNGAILYPADGVYVTRTTIEDKSYDSMTYVTKEIVETNLLNYNNFRYNFKIKVDFFRKIRDNQSFSNLEDLKLQIKKDLQKTKDFFELG